MSLSPTADAAEPSPAQNRWRTVTRRLFTKKAAQLSLAIILVGFLFALVPSLLAPHDPYAQELTLRLRPPAFMERGVPGYWLGTDQLGRDILSRIIYGARITLFVSIFAVLVSGVAGVAMGLIGGYYGGKADAVILRLIDIQLAFPLVLLVIAVVAVVGPSLTNLIIIMGLSGWPRFARVVRGSVLSVRNKEFVEAARAIGVKTPRIMLQHILPNVLSAVIVYASFDLARMILLEATLSFLGLGVQPPSPTWGGMISDGAKYMSLSWSVSLSPGIAIALLILAFNILGDELRDALDPQISDN
ncbi:ABC transporter permease [Chelatococcus asaccharovorans]|uniref:Peptide/nickel transport system permease protein n=1 Tax=Chelatococcus asaccharovorans TaxID=28210 RepID=A0A2V3UBA5_9HYPH|nr:ABC transporter permease [Chelatococcus asaccharovorans]MBS7703453.1 ABC transporter permease [Chelatococcus asaccharovorans]PXW61794.1 peptide/nickel transport system permease protein [Chelatococcus asaccharovorans]